MTLDPLEHASEWAGEKTYGTLTPAHVRNIKLRAYTKSIKSAKDEQMTARTWQALLHDEVVFLHAYGAYTCTYNVSWQRGA